MEITDVVNEFRYSSMFKDITDNQKNQIAQAILMFISSRESQKLFVVDLGIGDLIKIQTSSVMNSDYNYRVDLYLGDIKNGIKSFDSETVHVLCCSLKYDDVMGLLRPAE